jgi:hypothetical protein
MAADILLAECNGQGWLVRGDLYIDDLLANTLLPHVTVEVVTCESKSAIDALRLSLAGPEDTEEVMWLIHPAIMNRARGQAGELRIRFPEWSAALGADAMMSLQGAADLARHQPEKAVVMVCYAASGAPAMVETMTGLRCGLIQAQLVALGVAADRISRETREAAKAEQNDRIDLMISLT